MKRIIFFVLIFYCALFPPEKGVCGDAVILATTTSVQDTGLLDVLVQQFTKTTGMSVKPVAVGTGQALELGRLGEADILWVHSPDDEMLFVEKGYGVKRTMFMHNDFVLLGPESDPASIKGMKDIIEAFKKIYKSKNLFISRGDKSGTHKKELKIWELAGITPFNGCYQETGQGMAQTIGIANEKQAYCLADRSTCLSLNENINLVIVLQGDDRLKNEYSLILVDPARFPKVNTKGALAFYEFMLSKEARETIENFGKDKFGRQLFYCDYILN